MKHWTKLKKVIQPLRYGIASYMITTLAQLMAAKELPELYMKANEEMALWKMLRRVSDRVEVVLDTEDIDQALNVVEYSFKDVKVKIDRETDVVLFEKNGMQERRNISLLTEQPIAIFKEILSFCQE